MHGHQLYLSTSRRTHLCIQHDEDTRPSSGSFWHYRSQGLRLTLFSDFLNALLEDLTCQCHFLLRNVESRDESNHVEYGSRKDKHTLLDTLLGDSRTDILDSLGILGGYRTRKRFRFVCAGSGSGKNGRGRRCLKVRLELDTVNRVRSDCMRPDCC